jgi:hypothetical protein
MSYDVEKLKFDAAKARKMRVSVGQIDPFEECVFHNMKHIYASIKDRTLKGFAFFDYEVAAFETTGGACDPNMVAASIKQILEKDGYDVLQRSYVLRIMWLSPAPKKKTKS